MQINIESLVEGGKGLGHLPSGKAVLVEKALPGETVVIDVYKENASYCFARVTSLIVASPERVIPPCQYYDVCGGCDLQHLHAKKEAEEKERIVLDNIKRLGRVDSSTYTVEKRVEGPAFGYRNRVRIHYNIATEEAGFLSPKSNTLVPIDYCPVLCDELNEVLASKEILKREARNVMFSGKKANGPFVEIAAFVGDDGISFGDKLVHIEMGEHTYSVNANVFFQSNKFLLPELLSYVSSLVEGGKVMDLYSGVGSFSAVLPKGTVAVERQKECRRLALLNAPDAISYTDAVEKWARKKRSHVDTIVVDPPRTGLERTVPHLLSSFGEKRVIYVSCNSVTLGRDIGSFIREGFKVLSVKVFDFYPNTHGTESVVVLER